MGYMHLWFCAGAMMLAAAGTYILWGPSNRPKRKRKDAVPGLQNFGNSCFLNSVLQALVACPSCITWLMTVTESVKEELSDSYPLIKALLSVFTALKRNDDYCSAIDVVEALRAHRWVISNEEQDAHELFHVLTTTIEEELTSATPVLSLFEASKLEDDSCCHKNEMLSKKAFISSNNLSILKNSSPTRGLLVSELICKACCSKYPTRYDTFDSISLVIPTPHWKQITLQDLLQKFISCELVQDVSCDICTKKTGILSNEGIYAPKSKTTFMKKLSFGKLPKCLCIHIQRTMWLNNGISMKCFDYITFPEILIMDQYVHCNSKKYKKTETNYPWIRLSGGNCSKKDEQMTDTCTRVSVATTTSSSLISNPVASNLLNEKQICSYNYVFLLKAVIVHLGDTSSGHFITYRCGAENSQNEHKWFCVSDTDVKEVSFAEVSRCCAYMMFYEKMD